MKKLRYLLIVLAMIFLCMTALGAVKANAATSVSVKSVDYTSSTITVQLTQADTALYISDKNMKKWEFVPVAKAADNTVTFDISWMSSTKDYILTLKGDASTEPVKITIPKLVTTFKVTYSTLNNNLTFSNAGERSIQWKKREALTWSPVTYDGSGNMISPSIESLCDNGSVLYFRLAPVNGTGINSPGARPSKEVICNIARKSEAPNITVNDQYLAMPVNKNLQYRYVDSDNNPTGDGSWTTFTKNGFMMLSEIANSSMISNSNPTPSASTYIQFRSLATSSKQMSNTKTIEIPAQKPLPANASTAIKLVYTSSTTFELRIPYAGADTPYEYAIINVSDQKDGITIDDYESIKWKEVTSTAPVTINKDKDLVADGSLIYVRRKAVKSLGDEAYALASPTLALGTIAYPGNISSTSGNSLQWLTTVAGRCNADNTAGHITFTLYSPTDNVIKEIKFVDYASTSTTRATLTLADSDFKSSVAENVSASSATGDDKYIITTTIMSTHKLDKFADNESTRRMLAYITLEDSTEAFQSSDDDGGVALYISPASKVNNPADKSAAADKKEIAGLLNWTNDTSASGAAFYNEDKDVVKYSTAFTRVVNSTKRYVSGDPYYGVEGNYDETSFRVRVDFGTRFIPDETTPGSYKADKVKVEKIKYDGVYFEADQKLTLADGSTSTLPAFTVEYADTKNSNGEDTRLALMTINADVIELSSSVDDRNKDTAVIIYLSNGEILTDKVTLNLRETATIVGAANSWSVIEGSLKESDTYTTTTDGTTTVKSEDHVDRKIALTVFKEGYDVTLESVTWKGKSVCSNICKEGTSITMNLDNKQINQIDVDTTTSAYLVFTFDNGFKITTGWKLTINASATN